MRGRPSNRELAWVLGGGLLTGFSQPFVVGAISTEPLDPTGLSGLLAFVGLVPALVIAADRPLRHVFGLALVAWWVHFVVVAHWLVVAFSTFGGIPLFGGVGMMLAMTSGTGAFLALGSVLAHACRQRRGWPLWATFPPALAALELLRNYVPFGGCPWGNLGNSLASVALLRQGASLVGVYGLVFVVALVNAAIAEAWLSGREGKPSRGGVWVAAAVLAVFVAWGATRLSWEPEAGETVRVGVLQASIPQEVINAGDQAEMIRATYQDLQEGAVIDRAEVVVWPEAALLPVRDRGVPHLRTDGIRKSLPPEARIAESYGTVHAAATLVGAITTFRDMDEASGRLVKGLHTGAFVVDRSHDVVDRYDKTHLVPFGEYVPWPFHLVMGKLISDAGEVFPGEEVRPVTLPLSEDGVKVGVTICYEGVFPEIARELANEGATQLYNLTNDAWYGVSGAPYQHLAMYQLRAVETGRPVLRAANSGVSAVIDSRGRVLQRTKLQERTYLVADAPLAHGRTPFLVLGDWLAWLSLAVSLGLVVAAASARRRQSTVSV